MRAAHTACQAHAHSSTERFCSLWGVSRHAPTARWRGQLYERLLMSNDKEKVLAVARKEHIPESPTEII